MIFILVAFCALAILADVIMVLLLYFGLRFIFKNPFCAEKPFLKDGFYYRKNMTNIET